MGKGSGSEARHLQMNTCGAKPRIVSRLSAKLRAPEKPLAIHIMEPLHCRLIDRPIHPFDLAGSPGALRLGQTMPDLATAAEIAEDATEAVSRRMS